MSMPRYNTACDVQYDFCEVLRWHQLSQKASESGLSYFSFHVENISHAQFSRSKLIKSPWCSLEEGDTLHQLFDDTD